MGAAAEICDRSSLDKYNLIGGAQKRGSVRGLSQVGGDRACWHFLLCLWLQSSVSVILHGDKHWIFLLYVASTGNFIKAEVKLHPIPNLPSVKSYSGKYWWVYLWFVCPSHPFKMHNNLTTALTVGKTSLKRMLSSSPAPCNPSPPKNPPKTPKWPKKKSQTNKTSKCPKQRLWNNGTKYKKLERTAQ